MFRDFLEIFLHRASRHYIDTAFLQSYHGFPNHYFNMTPLAVESLLVDDFLLVEAYVPKSATPAIFPNTAVKHCSPDGSTAIDRARVGRRQN